MARSPTRARGPTPVELRASSAHVEPGDWRSTCVDPGDGSPGSPGADAAALPVCDPIDFGAKHDGKTKDTVALQAAINACAGKGGTVHLHDGSYLSGTLRLKSDLVVHIDASADPRHAGRRRLPAERAVLDNTQLINCRKSLLYAESVSNLRIEGPGAINGNGNAPRWIGAKTLRARRGG